MTGLPLDTSRSKCGICGAPFDPSAWFWVDRSALCQKCYFGRVPPWSRGKEHVWNPAVHTSRPPMGGLQAQSAEPSMPRSTTSTSPNAMQAGEGHLKRCPFCAEQIQGAAIICRFCGRQLNSDTPSVPSIPNAPRKALSPQTRVIGWVCAFLFPIGGVVVSIVAFASEEAGTGLGMLLVSLFMVYFWIGFWPAFSAALGR